MGANEGWHASGPFAPPAAATQSTPAWVGELENELHVRMVITAGTERQRQVYSKQHLNACICVLAGAMCLGLLFKRWLQAEPAGAMQHPHLVTMRESKQVVPPEQRDLVADQAAAAQSDPAMVHQTTQTEPLLFDGSPLLPPRPPKPRPPLPPRRVLVPWSDNASTYFLEQDLDGSSKTVLVAMVQCLLCVSSFYCLKDSDGVSCLQVPTIGRNPNLKL
jgi:hypothetical protein